MPSFYKRGKSQWEEVSHLPPLYCWVHGRSRIWKQNPYVLTRQQTGKDIDSSFFPILVIFLCCLLFSFYSIYVLIEAIFTPLPKTVFHWPKECHSPHAMFVSHSDRCWSLVRFQASILRLPLLPGGCGGLSPGQPLSTATSNGSCHGHFCVGNSYLQRRLSLLNLGTRFLPEEWKWPCLPSKNKTKQQAKIKHTPIPPHTTR